MNSVLISKHAVVFAHYDKDNIVDGYVYFLLEELKKNCSYLVFVTTVDISKVHIEKLLEICSDVIVRENIGYDFMSYKVGLESFDYINYEQLTLCNDSIYGPFYNLKDVYKSMDIKKCDFWGMTDNSDISYHVQSYFMVFRKSVIVSKIFQNFWNELVVLNLKEQIINRYEVGLSRLLINSGYIPVTYADLKPTRLQTFIIMLKKFTPMKIYKKIVSMKNKKDRRIGRVNVTHYFWKDLLYKNKMPFIKIELLRDNPMNIDIDDYEQVIQEISDYDTSMIKRHLKRLKNAR